MVRMARAAAPMLPGWVGATSTIRTFASSSGPVRMASPAPRGARGHGRPGDAQGARAVE